ncbi:MAG: WYL domain-containing protein [Lachnospiraceae bacterium]|nr:WYL domain-containing protein [Lachnospiraceae bacterium]
MYGTGNKKMLNMLILEILREYTDEDHSLTQQEIIKLLKQNYGMECDRRSVRSNIISLKEMGYDISTDKGNRLVSREFDDAELRLLIDGVFTSGAITDKEAHKLVGKLEKFSNKYFKSHVSYIHSTSSGMNAENQNVMDSIATIDMAISKGKKIAFSYLQYGIDFKLHPKRDIRYVVNPYQMINNKGKYYLIGNYEGHDNVSHYRLDRITNVEILEENRKPMKSVKGLEKGFNIQEYISERVYMFSGESERFKIRTNEIMMDALVDSFGKGFRVELGEDSDIIVTLKCNPNAFFFWTMQYGNSVEVLEPQSMRDRIKEESMKVYKKYK